MPNYRIKVSDRDGENIKTIEIPSVNEKRAREIAYGRDYLILEIDEIYDDSAPTPTQRIQDAAKKIQSGENIAKSQREEREGFKRSELTRQPLTTEYLVMRTAVFWGVIHAWIAISVITLVIWIAYLIIASIFESTSSGSYY